MAAENIGLADYGLAVLAVYVVWSVTKEAIQKSKPPSKNSSPDGHQQMQNLIFDVQQNCLNKITACLEQLTTLTTINSRKLDEILEKIDRMGGKQ